MEQTEYEMLAHLYMGWIYSLRGDLNISAARSNADLA
jgi:hypothetical protein